MLCLSNKYSKQIGVHLCGTQWRTIEDVGGRDNGFSLLSVTFHTTALISHASKVMLKILQARLQQYVNREHPDVQAGFRKGRGTRD